MWPFCFCDRPGFVIYTSRFNETVLVARGFKQSLNRWQSGRSVITAGQPGTLFPFPCLDCSIAAALFSPVSLLLSTSPHCLSFLPYRLLCLHQLLVLHPPVHFSTLRDTFWFVFNCASLSVCVRSFRLCNRPSFVVNRCPFFSDLSVLSSPFALF